MKQTKLTFTKKETNGKGKGRKKKNNSDEDIDLDSDGSFSGSDVEFTKPIISSTRTARNTKKKINYSFDSEDEKMSSGDDELFENSLLKEEVKKETLVLSDSDEESSPPKRVEVSSEDLFDSLIGKKSDDSITETKSNPPIEKRKRDDYTISDSDKNTLANKKARSSSPKNMFDSDDDFSAPKINSIDSDEEVKVVKKVEKVKRAPKPIPKKTTYISDSDSDEDFGKKQTKSKKIVDSDEDFDIIKEKKTTKRGGGRAKKAVKYASDSDDDY